LNKVYISKSEFNQDQYDGNIKAIRWSNTQLDNAGLSPKAYAYSYNQNKWLSNATFGSFNFGTNTITPLSQYAEGGLSYDANGNIRKLRRTDDSGSVLDNLKYLYKPGTNQLDYVNDNVVSSATDDIEGQMPNNYQYNAIGQLIRNESEDLDYFYNVQGLTTEVRKSHLPVIKFYYNERGERIKKESFSGSTLQSTDYYVLDASGNTLGVYTKTGGGSIALTEIPVYGGNRLGVFNYTDNSTNYQITDHLGNVRAVIKKLGTAPSLQQYADYYPFGEQLPLRNSMAGYRYAYQGQELDDKTGMEAFKLRLWDGRIGRWLNPDPYGQFFSPYLGMGNNPISSIDPDGGWKKWFGAWWHSLWDGKDGEIFQSKEKGDWGIKYFDRDDSGVILTVDFGGKRFDNNKLDYFFNYKSAELSEREFNLFFLHSFSKYETYEKYFNSAGAILGGVSAEDLITNSGKSLIDGKITKSELKSLYDDTKKTIGKPTFILGSMMKAMGSVEGNMKEQWFETFNNYTNKSTPGEGVRIERYEVQSFSGIPGSPYPTSSTVTFYNIYTRNSNILIGKIHGF
jgi:RHS repeat-associated protein